MMNKKNTITTQDIMGFVWNTTDFVMTAIKGILIVGGAIAAASADVVLGALTLNLLFTNISGAVNGIEYAPLMISMGASGIQLILWQIIQNKGGVNRILKSKNFALIIAFIAVILLKFADDITDIAIVNYLMIGSTLPQLGGIFSFLQGAVMFVVWVLTGFSEIFVVNAIDILKNAKEPQKQKQKYHKPTFERNPRFNAEILEKLQRKG